MARRNLQSEGRKALKARLGTITPENNYSTRAGTNVQSGWFNEVIQAENVAYPLVVVQRAKDQDPKHGADGIRKHCGFNIIGAVKAGLDDYEDALDDLELDLIECLMPLEGVPVEWLPNGIPKLVIGAAQQVPPGEGLNAATVIIPVYLHLFVQAHPD